MTAAAGQGASRGREAAARRALRPISVAERFSSPHVALLWLVRLRWHALVALAVAMTLAPWLMGVRVPWLPAVALVSGIALSNLASLRWAGSGRPVHTAALGALLLADTLLLSAALALSGGSLNPFVTLYLIEVTLAALILDLGWVIAVGVTAVSGYAFLLISASGAPTSMGAGGALVALAITLGINATLVVRMATAFRQRQAALVSAQREAAQAEKLASLTTLAAGAAHELATPLGSIAVAATELEGMLDSDPAQARVEARVIREQVDRCKHILQRLGARAGSEPGELPRPTTGAEAFERVRHELGARSARLETLGDTSLSFDVPLDGLAAVLTNLVTNAFQASPPDATVTLSLDERGERVRFTTSDRGVGIDPALLPRLGEPFFTTKAPGGGLGLGLFLAFRFSRTYGGKLDIESSPGGGTRVSLELPKAWSGAA